MIKLTRNICAVTPLFDPDKTAGGLYIPDMAKERCDQGIVTYVGPKVETLKYGDHVLFSGYTGTTVRIEGEGLLILVPEDFITCVIEPAGTDVDGLYFRGTDGEYFRATYEQAMYLIARAFEGQGYRDRIGIRDRKADKPAAKDYDKLR